MILKISNLCVGETDGCESLCGVILIALLDLRDNFLNGNFECLYEENAGSAAILLSDVEMEGGVNHGGDIDTLRFGKDWQQEQKESGKEFVVKWHGSMDEVARREREGEEIR